MPTLGLLTFRDCVRHLMDLTENDPNENIRRDARRAVLEASDEFPSASEWSYYLSRGRITTVASQTEGTIAYDNTGGAAERLVTLTDSTWPSWAAFGMLTIDNVAYEVATRESSTTLTLSVNSNPGADVAAETEYTLYRDIYPMPIDFIAADQFLAMGSSVATPAYAHPRDWLGIQRAQQSTGTPAVYTFLKDPNYAGAMAVAFADPPDDVYVFDFVYSRRPRLLVIEEYKEGTVSVTGASATVTGSGTTFTSDMVGSVLRIASSATADYPEAVEWSNRYGTERVIISYTSATSVTVDTEYDTSLSGAKYVISDPVDLERGSMKNAFLRCCEKQTSIARHFPIDRQAKMERAYTQALILAREADSRNKAWRVAGEWWPATSQIYNTLGDDAGVS